MTTSSVMESENRCLIVRQDELQFASFSFWVVAATMCADELGITRNNANEMPDVSIFGEDYLKMFRDAIYFAGTVKFMSGILESCFQNVGAMLSMASRRQVPRYMCHQAFSKTPRKPELIERPPSYEEVGMCVWFLTKTGY